MNYLERLQRLAYSRYIDLVMINQAKELLNAPYDVEKANFLRGNYDLAAQTVFDWYESHADYIKYRDDFFGEKSDEGRKSVYQGELDEVNDAKKLYWDKVVSGRNRVVAWEDDPLANEMWVIASEWADVAIVGASILRNNGWSSNDVAKLWAEDMDVENLEPWVEQYREDISTIKRDMGELGIDFAEAVMNKVVLNEEHYDMNLLPWVLVLPIKGDPKRGDNFGKILRKNVGDASSQMPDMNMHPKLGEMILGRKIHKSPFGTNGNSPVAIIFEQDRVMVAESDRSNDYGLYRM